MSRWSPLLLLLLSACRSTAALSPVEQTAEQAAQQDGTRADDTTPETASTSDNGELGQRFEPDEHDDGDTVEDEPEDSGVAEESSVTRPHPLDGWSDAELEHAVRHDLAKLGSISLGQPSAGLLLNGVQATENAYFKLVSPHGAFGTQETLDYLNAALKKVHAEFPGSAQLSLGHISVAKGGHLKPHISHQCGRDLDISFYYRDGAEWYRRGTASNLDVARNWAFVRALVTETDVEMILVDHSIQALLREHARAIGEDADWLDSLFRGGAGMRAIIRHAPGHATHFHIRFFNPVAQETARRVYRHLVARGHVPPVQDYVHYRAKKGDTLGKLAKRFGASVDAIKRANGLKKSLIREKQVYLIPQKSSRPKPPPPRLAFPARRLPPERVRAASASAP